MMMMMMILGERIVAAAPGALLTDLEEAVNVLYDWLSSKDQVYMKKLTKS